MNWLLENMSFLTISGSQCYGFATELSDVDVKGFTLPPKEVREHLFNRFDQALNNPLIENEWSHLKNPKNPKFESTVYSLAKFFKLAAEVNPNIIELLWVNDKHILRCDNIGKKVLENRDLFLSSKAKFSFSGYAFAQFSRIERHRKWLLKGEIRKPLRADYGLPDEPFKGHGELERLVKREIENWNFSKFSLDELERQSLKETVWDCVFNLSKNEIDWGNWPKKYEAAAISKLINDFNISEEVEDLILRETRFKNDLKEYQEWLRWKENRNLDRKNLEKEYLYDTKHAAHLFRLMRMGCEILENKGVITYRPDAEELLAIRRGAYSYEKLLEEFDKYKNKIEQLYTTTTLPRVVDYEKINNLYNSII